MSIQTLPAAEKDVFKIVQTIIQLVQGRSNAVGSVSLTPSATSTVVQAVNCAPGATPILTAMSANAAAEIKNGTLWISAVSNGSFTITHANNAQTDRTFAWAAYG
jgi:hypothetical protein